MQFLIDALPHKGFVRIKLDKACETLITRPGTWNVLLKMIMFV